jgi:hypothetical protein
MLFMTKELYENNYFKVTLQQFLLRTYICNALFVFSNLYFAYKYCTLGDIEMVEALGAPPAESKPEKSSKPENRYYLPE